MKKAIKLFAISVICFAGCHSERTLKPKSYLMYMENQENNFRKEVKSGKSDYIIQLATPEYMVCKEFSENITDIDTALFQRRLNELNGSIFFLVYVKQKGDNRVSSDQMVMYYQSQAVNDIKLVRDSAQTVPAVYLFENNYSLMPYNTIITGFRDNISGSDFNFVFNDQFNDELLIRAKFSRKQMDNLPVLQF